MVQKSKLKGVSKVELHSVEGGFSLGGLVNFLKRFIPRTPPTFPIDPQPARIPIRA